LADSGGVSAADFPAGLFLVLFSELTVFAVPFARGLEISLHVLI
jgi:hypothetical protein